MRPRSLRGQLAAVIAVALLIAQSISFALLVRSEVRLRDAQRDAAIDRFVSAVDRISTIDDRLPRLLSRLQRDRGMFRMTDERTLTSEQRHAQTTRALVAALTAEGLPSDAVAALMPASDWLDDDPPPEDDWRDRSRWGDRDGRGERGDRGGDRPPPSHLVVMSVALPDGNHLTLAQPFPGPNRRAVLILIGQTVLIFAILLVGVSYVAGQLTRPLLRLTKAAEELRSPDQRHAPLPAEGPRDIRNLTRAFEDMRERIEHLFREKDVMLGAIGHDLRTPLTALRLRVEQVEDEKVRTAMSRTIEDLDALLNDILNLARSGQPDGDPEAVFVPTLIDDAIAGVGTSSTAEIRRGQIDDIAVHGYPILLTRALRHLIENACRYGGGATVSGTAKDGEIILSVTDAGPGMKAEDIERLRQPFERGELSRNAAQGGAGLGLSLADGIAKAHGGHLRLENRKGGGFEAALVLPDKIR